jgi:hypothetical protein
MMYNETCLDQTWHEGRLNSIIGPRAKQCTGVPTYTTTHRDKIVKWLIKLDIYLVLYWYFQQNQCLNLKKNMPCTTHTD